MKIKIIFIVFLLLTVELVNAQKVISNCLIIDSILNVDSFRKSIGISENPRKIIRIIDSKNFLKKCKSVQLYSYHIGNQTVSITNQIPLDINTGLFLDMVLLSIKQNENKVEVDIFFVNNKCEDNVKHKYMCKAFLVKADNRLSVEKVNYSHIQ